MHAYGRRRRRQIYLVGFMDWMRTSLYVLGRCTRCSPDVAAQVNLLYTTRPAQELSTEIKGDAREGGPESKLLLLYATIIEVFFLSLIQQKKNEWWLKQPFLLRLCSSSPWIWDLDSWPFVNDGSHKLSDDTTHCIWQIERRKTGETVEESGSPSPQGSTPLNSEPPFGAKSIRSPVYSAWIGMVVGHCMHSREPSPIGDIVFS